MAQIGVILVLCICLVLPDGGVEPKRTAMGVGLQRLQATDLGLPLVVGRDVAYDPSIGGVECIGNAGEFRREPEGFLVT